jgi:hypothetical protein
MSSFLCLVIGVFRNNLTKIPKCFFKSNVWFKVGSDSFSQNNTKKNKDNVWLWGFIY